MKLIIIGGAGFIGHNVTRILESQGHECLVIDSNNNYQFIPHEELDYLAEERQQRFTSEVYPVDICNYGAVDHLFRSSEFNTADAVIHLASFPRQKVVSANPLLAADVMGPALINLLELSAKYRIPRFVYISSSMVYGDFTSGVVESAVCDPQGQYAIMKHMGELMVKDYARRGCFDYTIIRPSAVYGEWDVEDRVISKFMLSALRGENLRVHGAGEVLDFTHVEDTAQGIVLAGISDNSKNKTYNITRSNENTKTLKEVAELIIEITGSESSVELLDRDTSFPSRGRLSIDSAKKDFGYDPQIDLAEGLKRYHRWFQESKFWVERLALSRSLV